MTELNTNIYEREHDIRHRISQAFKNEFEPSENVANDIGFHMTDWLGDVDELVNTYSRIQALSDKEIIAFVIRFLSHVPNHLNAAMKLTGLGPVTDVFELGIFEEDE